MKANELRIGNLVHDRLRKTNLIVTAYSNAVLFTGGATGKPISLFEPIPLTEEWLLKFGFEDGTRKRLGVSKDGEICVSFHRKRGIAFISDSRDNNYAFSSPCEHVHQLQNLYFALCGEELTINEEE